MKKVHISGRDASKKVSFSLSILLIVLSNYPPKVVA